MAKYPNAPGYTEPTTSKLAAKKIHRSGRAKTLRDLVLDYFNAGNKATAEDVAEALEETRWAVQPRVSELRQLGLVRPSGGRKVNPMGGGTAHIWQRTTAEEELLILTTGSYGPAPSEPEDDEDDDDDDGDD